ncbi:hexosaminidase D-like [Ornithodoros turicata]
MNETNDFMHRLVHLDLKGAAFKLQYYEKLFPFLRNIGATGLLIEYEDTFPYDGELSELRHPEAYSQECILQIQQMAKHSNLIVVPLVQTFGHLEFVLKLQQFFEFREMPRYPNVLCPTHPKSASLVQEMVSQVIQHHPEIQWFHLGADEVWHLGQCDRCQTVLTEQQWSKDHLFLDYLSKLVRTLQQKYPHIRFIVWDDMMREMDPQVISGCGLHHLVEPMVWHYLPQSEFRLKQSLWDKYLAIFPKIWIASAFKGATKINQILAPPSFHISNHEAWNRVLSENSCSSSSFRGIALTGWQRFDHLTVLCELLPVAIPCLALCLKSIISRTGLTTEACSQVSREIGYYGDIEPDIYPRPRPVPPAPTFPGGQLYVLVLHLANVIAELEQVLMNPSVQGGFHEFLVAHNRTNPLHIDQFVNTARKLLVNIEALYKDVRKELSEIYYQSTVEEWLSTYISPYRDKLKKLVSDADLQIAVNVPM